MLYGEQNTVMSFIRSTIKLDIVKVVKNRKIEVAETLI